MSKESITAVPNLGMTNPTRSQKKLFALKTLGMTHLLMNLGRRDAGNSANAKLLYGRMLEW